MPSDLRTHAIVLRRTNYGESDRILNLLTPEGKIAVLAKSVRKSKSRLAGGIELFSVADVVVHQGRSNLGTLTSAKMLRFYGGIMTDVARLELAGNCLKRLDRVAEQVPSPEHFQLLQQTLAALDCGLPNNLITTWFTLNLARANGDEINLLRDTAGSELTPNCTYSWDQVESALRPDERGPIGAQEIKLARFLLQKPLAWANKVENCAAILPPIYDIAKTLA